MNCEQMLERMSAALDGELSAEERAELDAHLELCPDCAHLFAQLAGQSALIRQLDCDVPAGLSQRILSQLPPQQKKPAPILHLRRWGALAACLVLVALGGIVLTGPFAPAANDTAVMEAETAEDSAYSTRTADEWDAVNVPEAAMEPVPSAAAEFVSDPALSTEMAALTPGTVRYLRTDWLDRGDPAVHLISTPEDLSLLLAQYPDSGNSLGSELTGYDSAYFEHSALIAVMLEENSGSVSHTLESLSPCNGGWEIRICRHVSKCGTCDMAGWLILMETEPIFSSEDRFSVIFTS